MSDKVKYESAAPEVVDQLAVLDKVLGMAGNTVGLGRPLLSEPEIEALRLLRVELDSPTPDGEAKSPTNSGQDWMQTSLSTVLRHFESEANSADVLARDVSDPAARHRFKVERDTYRYVLKQIAEATPDGPASPVLPDDDHPILLALRDAVASELESCGYRDEDGELCYFDGEEWIAKQISDKVKPLLGASPVLGDEGRERRMCCCSRGVTAVECPIHGGSI